MVAGRVVFICLMWRSSVGDDVLLKCNIRVLPAYVEVSITTGSLLDIGTNNWLQIS